MVMEAKIFSLLGNKINNFILLIYILIPISYFLFIMTFIRVKSTANTKNN
jgi:hypothetical protein